MTEKIILTTCTAGYLAQAKALGDSLLKYNPDYKLVIGLVDKIDERIKNTYWHPHQLIEVQELNIPQFEEMYKRYTTLELVCALKSFFTDHLLEKFNPSLLIFLDCDIMIFDSLAPIEYESTMSSILLTPHITQPFPADDRRPREKDILKTGMFNAGFYGLRNDDTTKKFLEWWKERMVDQAYERPKEGLNIDQKWLNFVPLYFENVKIIRHTGCNTAYWNLHERSVEMRGDKFFVNNEPLLFFHYSGYSSQHPDKISKHQDRFSMKDNAAIEELFRTYDKALVQNDHPALQKIPCYYKKESSGNWFKKVSFKK
jgi:hypothetical protein